MNISYEWKITALKQAPTLSGLSNVITNVEFRCTGTDADSGESVVFNGGCDLAAPQEGDEFIALADLTEADVIAWAQANHSIESINNFIEEGISEKITPKNVDVSSEDLSWLATSE